MRDIVLTCVILHNMLRSHQGGAYRPPTSANDIQPPQADQGEQGHNHNFRNPSITWECWLGLRSEFKKTEARRLRGEHAVIYQSFSGLIQELLFQRSVETPPPPPKKKKKTTKKNNNKITPISISPKTCPITNTIPSQNHFTKSNINSRFKPRKDPLDRVLTFVEQLLNNYRLEGG